MFGEELEGEGLHVADLWIEQDQWSTALVEQVCKCIVDTYASGGEVSTYYDVRQVISQCEQTTGVAITAVGGEFGGATVVVTSRVAVAVAPG